MTRLTISYHHDTNEPVAVQTIGEVIISAPWSRDTGSHASRNTLGGIYGSGPLADQCKALLARERVHWLASRLAEATDDLP